jgi:CRISPR-associated endoribonuclease Cas6
MRFLLTLNVKNGNRLPLNYQYPVSSWIYKVIAEADGAFASWLHNQGYVHGRKSFKFFCFSRLMVPKFRIAGDRMIIQSDKVQLYICFGLEASAEKFIIGLFQRQRLGLGDRHSVVDFEVAQIEAVDSRLYSNTYRFRTLSPICVSRGQMRDGKLMAQYLSPDDEGYERIFLNNLVNKSLASMAIQTVESGVIGPELSLARFKLLSEPKKRGQTFKAGEKAQTKVIGYDFDFELTAPMELLEIGYSCGFGEKNSEGFGMVEVK